MTGTQKQQINIPPTLIWAVIAFFAVQTLGGIGAFYSLQSRVAVCEKEDENLVKKVDKMDGKLDKIYDILMGKE
jgi:hypothetical protein